MPSGQTAADLIESALRLGGAVGVGEVPTSDEINDGLVGLNDLIEIMSLQNLLMYGTVDVTFPTVANQAVYTVGPAGNWAMTSRPVRINDNPYCTYQGVDFPIQQVGQEDYDLIALKTQQGDIVERLLFVNDSPLGRITLWPVPRGIVNISFAADRILTQVPNVATVMNYPPGYLVMMKHQLCILLMPDYGRAVSDEITETARFTMAAVKRANKKKRTMAVDAALVANGPVDYLRGY